MGYEDFVWFIMSEEDKSSEMALDYWFKCCDLDGDGCLRANEMLVSCGHCALALPFLVSLVQKQTRQVAKEWQGLTLKTMWHRPIINMFCTLGEPRPTCPRSIVQSISQASCLSRSTACQDAKCMSYVAFQQI